MDQWQRNIEGIRSSASILLGVRHGRGQDQGDFKIQESMTRVCSHKDITEILW